jgi:5-methylcytosine-specific restriction endonuclease McrA
MSPVLYLCPGCQRPASTSGRCPSCETRQRSVYSDRRWAIARASTLARDGYRCSRCRRTTNLDVHHLTPLNSGGEPFDPANLAVLCRSCHQRIG